MGAKLIITLDEEATQNYLGYARKMVEAEVNEDCEPSGITISVSICPPYGATVFAGPTEFGEADVVLKD
ncbi:MAG: hypothetical protein LAT67_05530 [Balneolales bacterium]|nr:hypothetical protein [Balneolales bacterium]